MEWTETEIRWFYDNKPLIVESYQKELSNDHHFFDKPFKLVISLGVGGKDYFPGLVLNEKDADEWPCSLLIIDYVRVFKLSDKNSSTNFSEFNQIRSIEICKNVMPLIISNSKISDSSVSLIAIISIISLLLLLAIIPLIIIQFIRMKKIRKSVANVEGREPSNYFDINNDCDQGNYCEPYDDVYDMVSHNKNNEYIVSEEMERSGQQMALNEQNYEIMTNRNVSKYGSNNY